MHIGRSPGVRYGPPGGSERPWLGLSGLQEMVRRGCLHEEACDRGLLLLNTRQRPYPQVHQAGVAYGQGETQGGHV